MNSIEVKIIVDARNSRQVQALNDLIAVLAEDQISQTETTPAFIPKQKELKTESARKKVAGAEKNPVEETGKAPWEIKIEEVRALLVKKVENNRSEIKAKLTELGAPNVTALDKGKYAEFVEFLNGLE